MSKADAEQRILEALKEAGRELHTEEVAERVDLTRHTVSKYLQVLRAKGSVDQRRVGNAKLWSKAGALVTVRPLESGDLDRIVDIEKQLQRIRRQGEETGLSHEEQIANFTRTVEHHLAGDGRGESVGLGAETPEADDLVGFVMGEVRMWEFGGAQRTGWIEILAVDPTFQRKGVGRRLGEAILDEFRRHEVRRVRTLVDAYSGELIAYFRSLGFDVIPMLSMEKAL